MRNVQRGVKRLNGALCNSIYMRSRSGRPMLKDRRHQGRIDPEVYGHQQLETAAMDLDKLRLQVKNICAGSGQ